MLLLGTTGLEIGIDIPGRSLFILAQHILFPLQGDN